MNNYVIVSEKHLEDLNATCDKLIDAGFNPVGGVVVKNDMFYQAMHRSKTNKIIDIIILENENVVELNRQAQEYINKGYQPENLINCSGGDGFFNNRMSYVICLVKRESDNR